MAQSPEKMKELVGYLKNIKSYERDHIKSERSTIGMMWGLFIFIGGLLDGYIATLLNYSPHAPVWFSMIAAAMVTQQIISSQPLLYEESFTDEVKRESVSKLEVILIIIIMGLTIPVGQFAVQYVMPYIGFAFGTMNLLAYFNNPDIRTKRQLLIVGSFYLSSILGLTAYLINPANIRWSGLIFGLIVGSTAFTLAYMSRNELIEK